MEYTLRENPRAKRITITVRRDGEVRVTKPKRASMRDVERFLVRSEEWIRRMQARQAALPKVSRVESSKKEYPKYKAAARDLVARRITHFNAHYSLRHGKIVIRNQSSRWGSCSHKGDLSFNYRLLFLPPELADYVVVHELCHLRELNHSRRFWALVAEAIPDYASRRKRLNKLSYALLIH